MSKEPQTARNNVRYPRVVRFVFCDDGLERLFRSAVFGVVLRAIFPYFRELLCGFFREGDQARELCFNGHVPNKRGSVEFGRGCIMSLW